MAIAPPRRISKTRKRKRRTHFKLDVPGMMLCSNCGEVKLSHHICKACGFYDGQQVLKIEKKVEEVVEEKPAKKTKKSKAEDGSAAKAETKLSAKKTTKPATVEKGATKAPVAKKTTRKPQKAD